MPRRIDTGGGGTTTGPRPRPAGAPGKQRLDAGGGGGPGGAPAKKHGGGGFFGTIGEAATNFAGGAERSVLGLLPAAEHLAVAGAHDTGQWISTLAGGPGGHRGGATGFTHYKPAPGYELPAIVKPIYKSYAYKYGPLFHGHVGRTINRAFVQDPFGTIIDGITIASLGSLGAERLALALGRITPESVALRELPLRGPEALAKAGRLRGDLTAIPSEQPLTIGGKAVRGFAVRHRAVHSLLNELPARTHVFGELARYNRAISRVNRIDAARMRQLAIPFSRAAHKLNKDEKVATALIARWPIPRLLDEQIGKWQDLAAGGDAAAAETAGEMVDLVSQPEVRALYEQPSKNMATALAEAQRLGEHGVALLDKYGKLDPQTAFEHLYMHQRVASGAVFDPGVPLTKNLIAKRMRVANYQAKFDRAVERTKRMSLTGEQRKTLGPLSIPSDLSTEIRVRLPAMEKEVRRLTALHNQPATDLLEQRAALNRLTRLGNEADRAVQQFAEKAGTPGGVAGLAQIQEQVDALTETIKNVRGQAPEDLTALRKQVQKLRTTLREEERPKGYLIQGEAGHYAVGPRGEVIHPRAWELAQKRGAALSVAKDELVAAEQSYATRHGVPVSEIGRPPGLVGGQSIDELRAEADALGRPQPVYLHDTAAAEPTGSIAFEPRGGGAGVQNWSVHQSQAILASAGQLLLDPTTLVGKYFKDTKYATYVDIHNILEDNALRVPKGTKLPKGWTFVKRAVGPKGTTAEKIGYLERTAGDYQRQVDDLMGAPQGEQQLIDGFSTKIEGEAAFEGKDRLIIPESTVKAMTGEFTRSSSAIVKVITTPLAVWRWLLLRVSPRWLANNIFGNSFMALLRFGGPEFVKNWLHAVRSEMGPATIERLAKDEASSVLTHDEFAYYMPEQAQAGTLQTSTGLDTARLPARLGGKVIAGERVRRHLREGLAPIDRGYEQRLRYAAGLTRIKKSPEVRAVYKRMPEQTRTWRAATKKAFDENPILVKKISQEINSGLGNFFDLSSAERNAIRTLVPFYSWYKALIGVVLKLPFEAPLRTLFISKLSQLQQEEQDMMNPGLAQQPWLRGAIPFGSSGGAILTQGVNPYATGPQVGRGLLGLTRGGTYNQVRAGLGLLNPGLQALPSAVPGYGQTAPGLPQLLLQSMFAGTPPVTAIDLLRHGAKPSKTYVPSARDQWLSLLGVPVRHLQQPIRR